MIEKLEISSYKVAIYIRLSKEDIDRGYDDSESVKNQKVLLTEYVKNLGWQYELIDTYIDQGCTGTNFNRPEFQRMIRDIENGKVNMVVTKDLSRLGREYIETGEYIEKWFPDHDVRYISVTDGIDTFAQNNSNNDVAPFKSILNDMYSKDLSKKIKTALRTMQRQGKWVASKTAIGYKKDPNDKNKLIICEEEAKIVRKIFEMASNGKTLGDITKYLNQNKIPTPGQIRNNKVTFWENKTVKNILKNEVYIGNTVQNKRNKMSYKNKRIRVVPKEQWIRVENTHEPIIDGATFYKIQKMVIVQKYDRNEKKNFFLLDGLLVCYECKHKIGIKVGNRGKHKYASMVCNYYRRNSKLGICTSHGFSYSKLENTVLEYMRNLFLNINNKKIKENIKNNKTMYDYEKLLKQKEKEISVLKNNMDKMYIDKLNNKITEEMYSRVFDKLLQEINNKKEEYKELEDKKENVTQDDGKDVEKIIDEFLKLKEPTPEIMKILINRIEIHQNKQIDIYFNFKKLNNFKENYDKTIEENDSIVLKNEK